MFVNHRDASVAEAADTGLLLPGVCGRLRQETDKWLSFPKAISLSRADSLPKEDLLEVKQLDSEIILLPAFPSIQSGRKLPCV